MHNITSIVLVASKATCTQVAQNGQNRSRVFAVFFYQDPERWCLGSYVKIGYFDNPADLLYQDEIGGPILTIPDRVIDTIYQIF